MKAQKSLTNTQKPRQTGTSATSGSSALTQAPLSSYLLWTKEKSEQPFQPGSI
jgi:hypothetical protein